MVHRGHSSIVLNDLQPAGGGAVFFSRVRIMCAGTLVEDISEYGRLITMFGHLGSYDASVNASISDFSAAPINSTYETTNFIKGI